MDDLESIMRQVREAVQADALMPRRHTFYGDTFMVYVRVTRRYILLPRKRKPVHVKTVELANIQVKPEFQRRGICKCIIGGLQSIAHESGRVFYVENVLNEHLNVYLPRAGFLRTRMHGGVSAECYVTLPPTR